MKSSRILLDCCALASVGLFADSSYLSFSEALPERSGDLECLAQAQDEYQIEGDWDWGTLSLKRISTNTEKPALFWVLYGEEGDETFEAPSQRGLASRFSFQEEDDGFIREPLAFLRDDNGDSHPDHAVLFTREGDPQVLRLSGDVWSRENGCYYWRKPVAHFIKWALDYHDWHPSLAYGHKWATFVDRLAHFWVEPEGESFGVTKDNLARTTVLDASTAERVFELISQGIADSQIGQISFEDENAYWESTQRQSIELFQWLGFHVQRAEGHPESASIEVEGFRQPLTAKHYYAPMLYVVDSHKTKPAVFDVILFNSWTSQEEWNSRLHRRVQ